MEGHPLALGFGGALGGVGPLEAPFQEPGFDSPEAEEGAGVGDGLLVVEGLAGEDVDVHIVPGREGVDADVAFGDDDEAGDAVVLGVGAVVFQDLGGGDFGHAQAGWVFVQEGPQAGGVPHHGVVAAETVDNQVHSVCQLPPYGGGRFRAGNAVAAAAPRRWVGVAVL